MSNETERPTTPQALQGIKVLELCSFVAGPYCARMLADMGAEVVKVEPPQEGDPARRRGPFYQDIPGVDASLLFSYLNLNKRGITLDLSKPAGHRIFMDLVARVDVLVEDLAPGDMQSLGLAIEEFHRRNPSLIVASVTPFGLTGPHRQYKATYLNTYHAGGDAYTTPSGQLIHQMSPEREPIQAGGYLGEFQAAVTASIAILGALVGRARDGQGHHIDLSKQEALVMMTAPDLDLYPNKGFLRGRCETLFPLYVGGLFQCKDGFCEILVNSDRSWEAVADFMGHPAWTRDPRFRTHEDRVRLRREVEDQIQAWAVDYPREELYHGLQKRGCPAGPVYTPTEVVRDEQMRQRDFWAEVDHPALGQLPVPSTGALFSQTPWRLTCPPPSLGQHNRDIYCGWLQMAEGDLAALRRAGVI